MRADMFPSNSLGRSGTLGGVLPVGSAVPLPLNTYVGALAAYSQRRLRTAYTGPLIRVRRSSDNAESDIGYGADGWLDGAALLAFSGEVVHQISPTIRNGGFETAGAGGTDAVGSWTEVLGGTSTITRDTGVFDTGVASARLNIDSAGNFAILDNNVLVGGRQYRYSIRAKSAVAGAYLSVGAGHTLTTEWATYTGTITAASTVFRVFSSTANAVVYLDSIAVQEVAPDAYVAARYDQSGNGYHQMQAAAAAQPKIVEAGVVLIEGSLLRPCPRFDGADDVLVATIPALGNEFSVFTAARRHGGAGNFGTPWSLMATGTSFKLGNQDTYYRLFPTAVDQTTWLTAARNVTHYRMASGRASMRVKYNALAAYADEAVAVDAGALERLSAGGVATGLFSPYNVGEQILFPSSQDASEAAIMADINAAWGMH